MAALVVTVTACSPSTRHGAAPTTTVEAAADAHGCATATPFGEGGGPHEIRGSSSNATIWGLALGPGHVPPRVGEELKIVWRMTGQGRLRVTFIAPDGHGTPLVFGPDAHSRSTYHRPGDEWGTGFRFTSKGCWHIHLTRSDTSGDVWIGV